LTHAAAAGLGGKLYVLGGRGSALGSPSAGVWAVDPATGKVRRAGRLPVAVSDPAAVTASNGIALDHGFQTALYVLTGLLVAGAVIAIAFVQSAPRPSPVAEGVEGDALVLEKAA
jgi:hypothetical protein